MEKNCGMDSIHGQILDYLEGKNDPVRTIDIAKQVYGPKATKKSINPSLYRLQKEGKIVKIAEENGANPRWKLVMSDN